MWRLASHQSESQDTQDSHRQHRRDDREPTDKAYPAGFALAAVLEFAAAPAWAAFVASNLCAACHLPVVVTPARALSHAVGGGQGAQSEASEDRERD